jgi:L-rhamnonate dehydratase
VKITDVEVLILEAPGNYEAPDSGAEAYGIKYLGIVRVSTDAGVRGYADLETEPHIAKAVVDAPGEGTVPGFQGLRSVLLGEDPFETERLWQKMYMASVYYGRRGVAIQVLSGIDIACGTSLGKRPLYQFTSSWAAATGRKSALMPVHFSARSRQQ